MSASTELIQIEAELSQIDSQRPPGAGEAFLRGAAQGVTLGFADEIAAAGEGAKAGVQKLVEGGMDVDDAIEAMRGQFDRSLEESRAAFARSR